MKQAQGKQEAIVSLLDVQKNNPTLLPNNTKLTTKGLNSMPFTDVRDLYVEVKATYYNSLDKSNKF